MNAEQYTLCKTLHLATMETQERFYHIKTLECVLEAIGEGPTQEFISHVQAQRNAESALNTRIKTLECQIFTEQGVTKAQYIAFMDEQPLTDPDLMAMYDRLNREFQGVTA